MDSQPLFDQTAEETLLGFMLVNSDRISEVDVQPEWFYVHRNREVWDAMQVCANAGGLDYVTLTAELTRRGKLAEIGGQPRLLELMQYQIYDNPERSARIIREMAQRRALVQVANEAAQLAYNLRANLSEGTGGIIDKISRLSSTSKGAVHWAKYLADLQTDVDQRRANPGEAFGIPTGFRDFDRITGGLQAGEMFLLSGKAGMGKSILAMQMARQLAETAPGAIYSVEMSGLQVVRREASSRSGVQARALKNGSIQEREYAAFRGAVNELSRLPVYMSDASNWTTGALRSDLARLKALHGIEWFVFDYLMLAGDAPEANETERTQIISRMMKLICRQVGLAGVVIHSMNKEGLSSGRPEQGALRGSGQVIYDADLIAFLTEFQPMEVNDQFIPQADQKNLRTLVFAKGRELEDPRKYLHLVKLPLFPAFGDYNGR